VKLIRPCFVIAILLTAGTGATCHKANSNLTPGQQAQVNVYASLNAIAVGNKTVAQSVVALNSSGTLGDDITRQILGYSKNVADSERAALAVLDSTQTPEAKALAVLEVMKKLALPAPIQTFLNSTPATQAVLSLVNSIVSIQQTIARLIVTPPPLLNTATPATKGVTP
jgi:hypothetical protein